MLVDISLTLKLLVIIFPLLLLQIKVYYLNKLVRSSSFRILFFEESKARTKVLNHKRKMIINIIFVYAINSTRWCEILQCPLFYFSLVSAIRRTAKLFLCQ